LSRLWVAILPLAAAWSVAFVLASWPAHGPDHARLWCLDCLALGLEIAPQPAGALKTGRVTSTVRCSTPDSPGAPLAGKRVGGGTLDNPPMTPTPPRAQTRGRMHATIPPRPYPDIPSHANAWGAFDNPAATSTPPRAQTHGRLHDAWGHATTRPQSRHPVARKRRGCVRATAPGRNHPRLLVRKRGGACSSARLQPPTPDAPSHANVGGVQQRLPTAPPTPLRT
jgi:hypothetical protein